MTDKPIPADVIEKCANATELVDSDEARACAWAVLRAAGWSEMVKERDEARASAAEWKKRAFGFDPEGVAAAARTDALKEAEEIARKLASECDSDTPGGWCAMNEANAIADAIAALRTKL